MREEGIVTEVSGGTAKVAIEPKPHCEHCNLCSRGDGGKRVVEANNAPSASPGDRVAIEVSPAQIVGTSLIVYAFPLAALVIGVALGYALSEALGIPEKKDLVGLALGAAGFLLAVLVIKAYDRHIARAKTPQAIITENFRSRRHAK